MRDQTEADVEAGWDGGYRHGLEQAAKVAKTRHRHWNGVKGHGVSCDVTACEEIAKAILALKDK